jgi:hypothetical protein
MNHTLLIRGLLAVTLAGLVGGCTQDNGMTDPTPAANVSLGVSVVHQLARTAHGGLVIDTAKILVRRVKFHQATSDDSADVKSGSFVLRLVPGAPVAEIALARIRPGVYDRLDFDIHKPEDFEIPPDPEFRTGSSGSQRFSVIVKGRYNDSAFVYRSRSEFRIRLVLETPLTVRDNGIARITFTVDPFACFGHHGLVFDPRDPSNESAIEPAIRGAFLRAFRDDDQNGDPD